MTVHGSLFMQQGSEIFSCFPLVNFLMQGTEQRSLPGGGGGTPIYGLYRYVPRDRVWFLRFSVLK